MEQKKIKITRETPLRKTRRFKRACFKSAWIVMIMMLLSPIYFLNTAPFRIKVVEISGTQRVGAEEIFRNSNIEIGDNMLMIPVASVRERVGEKQPLIVETEIKRIFPSRVKIIVKERTPFAYVTNGTQYFLIDVEGIVIEKPNGIADPKLFTVYSDGVLSSVVGEKLKYPHSEVFDEMVRNLESAIKGKYSQVRFDQHGIKLYLRDSTYVLLGSGDDLEKKILLIPVIHQRLKAAGEQFEGLNLTNLDVPSFIRSGPVSVATAAGK